MKEELAKLDPEAVWGDRDKILTAIDNVDSKLVALFAGYLEHLANGGRTKEFLSDHDLVWQDMVDVYRKRPEVYVLLTHAKKLGETYRQMAREDEADRRAMEGVDKPVYQGGRLVGYQKDYSDSLLALMLKAGNPDKFADRQKHEHKGVMLNMVIEGIERGTTPPEVKEVEAEEDE